VLLSAVPGRASLPLFGSIDSAATPRTRRVPIDGLRGFLALGVFVFHLPVTHRYVGTGVGAPPDSAFNAGLAPVGVSLSFMITGVLFWARMLRTQGPPSWLRRARNAVSRAIAGIGQDRVPTRGVGPQPGRAEMPAGLSAAQHPAVLRGYAHRVLPSLGEPAVGNDPPAAVAEVHRRHDPLRHAQQHLHDALTLPTQ
jgi:hypothetical protein